jgi:hypothetical protein
VEAMKIITPILLICILESSASTEQVSISIDTLFFRSKSLASEMGKTFQIAQNCGEDLTNISAYTAATLFRNYFEEHEVRIIIKQYELYVAQEKGKSCNREKIEFHILMGKMADYFRLAAPFAKK